MPWICCPPWLLSFALCFLTSPVPMQRFSTWPILIPGLAHPWALQVSSAYAFHARRSSINALRKIALSRSFMDCAWPHCFTPPWRLFTRCVFSCPRQPSSGTAALEFSSACVGAILPRLQINAGSWWLLHFVMYDLHYVPDGILLYWLQCCGDARWYGDS